MIVYHHNDADGRCAAAIVMNARERNVVPFCKEQRLKFREVDYADDDAGRVNFAEEVTRDELVVIVDFSFKPDTFRKLWDRTNRIVWIDHHKTAKAHDYAREQGNPYGPPIPGLRDFNTKGMSGAELTWKFCFDGVMPKAVRLVGDYDSWRHECKESVAFHEGLKTLDTCPESILWHNLIYADPSGRYRDDVLNRGQAAITYRDNYCAEMRKAFGHRVRMKGEGLEDLIVYALNLYRFGSLGFGAELNRHDVCASFVFDGERYTVSLYTAKDAVDVGIIARHFGGGGHKGAGTRGRLGSRAVNCHGKG